VPMVWPFPFGCGTACRSWAVVQPIPLSTMNAAPDLCCDKYRPAYSGDCSLSVDLYTTTIGICLSDFKACIPIPSPQILRTFDWQISFYAQTEFTYLARVFFKVLLSFRTILCTMVPYLVLASWKVVSASSTTAGLKEFSSQENPVWDFVLSHGSGFAKWIAQPRKPHLGTV
jgi:hypothetical protein